MEIFKIFASKALQTSRVVEGAIPSTRPITERVASQERPKSKNIVSRLYSNAVKAIQRKRFKKNLLDGVPKAMKKEAKEMISSGTTYSSFLGHNIYSPQYSQRAVSLEGARAENIQFKLDLLAKHDKSLYIGQHQHPINYITGTPGYENFKFENFEECIDQKLSEIAKDL